MKWWCTRCYKQIAYEDVYLTLKIAKCVCVECYSGLAHEIKAITKDNYDEE